MVHGAPQHFQNGWLLSHWKDCCKSPGFCLLSSAGCYQHFQHQSLSWGLASLLVVLLCIWIMRPNLSSWLICHHVCSSVSWLLVYKTVLFVSPMINYLNKPLAVSPSFEFTESCKGITECSHILHIQFFLLLAFY